MRLLFDLDGTLTDPFVGITNCIRHALIALGRTSPSPDELRWCIGPPLHQSFLTLLDSNDDHLAAEALRIYRERFGSVGLFENEVYPEIISTLEKLIERGHTLSVATSKPEEFAVRIIEHFGLGGYFHCVDGSQLDGIRSDKTSLIRYILERDQVNRLDAAMIGDRAHDIIGAVANGIYPVGALWGHGTHAELQSSGARAIVEVPSDLPKAIKEAEQNGASNGDKPPC